MQPEITFKRKPIEPFREIAAYETLWKDSKASFKSLSELFKNGGRPTDFVTESEMDEVIQFLKDTINKGNQNYWINLLINGTFDYPEKLLDAREPVQILYYSGNLDLLSSRSVAIVGTRNPTPEGLKRTEILVKHLVGDGFTIVSGLAKGIDTMAHKTALACGGRTIAVIGTPITQSYPKENCELQNFIAKNHLLVSQVPFFRYSQQGVLGNRLFFPERNKTMSALTEATVIVEAGETSGTLVQARAALQQGRKLFILDSCFQNKFITWPETFARRGAIRVKEYSDIQNALNVK